ncbi:V-set domain-containing T-cell activation inhibitor 1 isoform X1 [Conger conger]|uniref:V-set domain-containing T-cell activation inhibitor 1 isoform X1 n=1 Tax=Conger conger TaxID=82655 RepID=UPI002A59ED58|nr:V-set domain-containing T-cell activation inhibitor 1 isoform X1 [Conger conger]
MDLSFTMWKNAMAAAHALVYALVWIVTTTNGKIPDVFVSCRFSEDCLLPCAFKPAAEEVIGWTRQEVMVHSFAQGRDQLDQQHTHFTGRTALFTDQIAHGNASLLLKLCNTQDRGRYHCHVATTRGNQESFVIAKVEAPVQSLTLEMTRLSGHEELKCSSRDVYPAPHVSWYTVPPEPLDTLKPITRKMANKNGLYSVESKLRKLPRKDSSTYTYFCTVNSSYDTQTWRASLQERELSSEEGGELTIPCLSPMALHNFTLTWTFTSADESKDILTFNSQTELTSNQWAGQAQVDHDLILSGDGSLRLQNPQNAEHTGTYTCTFSNGRSHHMVHIWVNITATAVERLQAEGSSWLWVFAVLLAALAVLVTVLILCRRKKADRSPASKSAEVATEMHAMSTDERENGIQSENSNQTD